MATIIDPPNSVWPNGLKVDSERYVTFYPLGTNKVDISTVIWPDGDKLVSPFVYKNDKLVGFVDTKALTVSGSATTTMNYSHIEADFSSIAEGKLTVDAPNATVKKFKWSVTTDSGNSGDTIVLGTKYINCTTIDDVKAIEPNYQTIDIVDNVWAESLSSLTDGSWMFYECHDLATFNSDLRSLTNGQGMFYGCSDLEYFSADLSSLEDGRGMFMTGRPAVIEDFNDIPDKYKDSPFLVALGGFVEKVLNPESIKKILTSLPEYSDGQERVLQICMGGYNADGIFISNQASLDKITEITGITCEPTYTLDPTWWDGHDISYKGWIIRTLFMSKAYWEYDS